MAAASGGKCGAGALAGGVGSLATPLVNQAFPNPTTDASDLIGGTVATAVAGGIASVAGGGKFGNGAVTAAFAYLFNDWAHRQKAAQDGAATGFLGGSALALGCTLTTAGICAVGPAELIVGAGIAGGAAAGWLGAALRDLYDGTWNSDVPSMDVLESRRSPGGLYCQNVNCGAPTGGVTYPICQDCNDRLRNGGPPIKLENGRKIQEPIVPGEETDAKKK